ncbi:hypothetical protein BBK36DRAFT_1201421 [Trichoderma citrinoviride]|uniref:RRM domain-containing protein n=1 Tax=Trichoderma citrinoviride TaxID=58853 RepID=A0A2T4BB14_9HYPO|nr:hypothetical protein BBK36DRAFT_1201421 [Trichoderma citrinoviride]PTB66507.1 hypothetical protein BBK36DRAFT_1201421 [Trichoderma citrinoviride]
MPPKKKEQQKMSLGDFLADSGFGGGSNWADEVEETYVSGTQALPPARDTGRSFAASSWQDRGYSVRESVPSKLPEKPPYTAHLGNLSYDATSESVTDFFTGCDVVSVRIIEDRELQRPKGFGYVEFGNLEGLKKALTLDGQSFEGRMIKIKIADPPRGGEGREGRIGESARDLSEWTRKGPLPDLPSSRGPRNDFGERRPPRDPAFESRAPREMTWERRGPLSPLSPQEPGSRESSRARGPQEGLGERSDSYRGNRREPAAWGEGRQEGRSPRQYSERAERPERPERTATAAEKDFQWRDRMRPDSANAPATEAPASPGAAPATLAQGGRPRLNLQKRTVSEVADTASTNASDSKASPFGAARPIDTAAREKEIEEKRLQAIQEKREADEKAKEERRLAKEAAAAKAEAEAEAAAKKAAEAAESAEAAEAKTESKAEGETATKTEEEPRTEQEKQNGAAEQKVPIRTRDQPKDFNQGQKSRATESGNWRSASNEQRIPRGPFRGGRGGRGDRGEGPPRGPRNDNRAPRANGQQAAAAAAPAAEGDAPAPAPAPAADDDGWTTVAAGKKGRIGRV